MVTIEGLKRCAVICIVRHDDEHLMLHRNREPNRGLYVPVGGKLEPYESPRDAAIREIREETGIAVDDVRLIGTLVDTSPTAFNWWSAIYVADLRRSEKPQIIDCPEGTLGWFTRVELLALPMPSTDRYVYDYLARARTFAFSAEYDRDLKLIRLDDELAQERLI